MFHGLKEMHYVVEKEIIPKVTFFYKTLYIMFLCVKFCFKLQYPCNIQRVDEMNFRKKS